VLCQILMDRRTMAALEFDHPTTSQADHMVMLLPIACDLVAVMFPVQVQSPHQPQLLERIQGSVYGGEADAGLPLAGQAVELICAEVPSVLTEQAKHQATLGGHPQPLRAKGACDILQLSAG